MSRSAMVLVGSAFAFGACTNQAPTLAETPDATGAVATMETAHATEPPDVPETTISTFGGATDGLVVRSIPDEDPGPPFYARVGIQFFHDDGLLAIPFYRSPSCVPPDFDLLDFFHFPGPSGPGAFACPLLMWGDLLIEPDAPPGTFPRQVVLQGDAVPFRFVPSAAFEVAASDGEVTLGELEGLSPLRGTATGYHETLRPREGEHKIVIDAEGTLEDGRRFRFHTTHIADEARVVEIRIR